MYYEKKYPVYPGEYILMPEIEALLGDFKIIRKDAFRPLVNMDELADSFKIEMAIPGVKNEDILIQVHDHILSVTVLHKDRREMMKELKMHEFETECFERHIVLPDNADSEFASAEYRQGILKLYLPKTKEHSKFSTNQIVVY